MTFLQLGKHCQANNHASIFECAKCDDAFATYELYKEHLNAVHPISAGIKTKRCDSPPFLKQDTTKRHQMSHGNEVDFRNVIQAFAFVGV
jgi:hypothetical protein